MLFARQQGDDVFAVGEPGEEAVQQQQQEDGDHEGAAHLAAVAEIENDPLDDGEEGYAQKAPHRAPLARPYVKEGEHQNAQHDEDHPPIFAAEGEGEHAQGGGDALPPLEAHGDGIDVPDDDGHAAHIAGEVGDEHVCAREHIAMKDEVRHEQGQAALDHVTQKGQGADLEPELAAHVHGAGVAAAHLAHVFMLDLGNEQGEVEAADQIGYDRHEDEPIPDVCKFQCLHTLSLRKSFAAETPQERSYSFGSAAEKSGTIR